MFGILATASAAFGLIWTVWDSNENRKLNKEQFLEDKELTQQRLITDRFAKSATLLSDNDKAVRIAAIFSLERLARDSPQDHWTIMELLSAYVLEKSPLDEKGKVSKPNPILKKLPSLEETKELTKVPKPITNDVQAALTVIGRRKSEQDQDKRLDLSRRNLSSASLKNASFRNASLNDANLNNANLNNANLRNANLTGANLRNANLTGANLTGANLNGADLSGAYLKYADLSCTSNSLSSSNLIVLSCTNLSGTNLSGTNLSGADLKYADLSSAILSGADLSGTKNLTPERVKSAKNWRNAKYDDAMRKKLGLPLEPSKDKAKDTPNKPQPTSSPNNPDNISVTSP